MAEKCVICWRKIPDLIGHHHGGSNGAHSPEEFRTKKFVVGDDAGVFASASMACGEQTEFAPSFSQLLRRPLALVAFVPKDLVLFAAGAFSGTVAKTCTAPLDRIKLLMQTYGLRAQEGGRNAISFIEALALVGKQEGFEGYWKGNLPQVLRVIPYSAVQLFSYEVYKNLFKGKDGELSVIGMLAAGACAGMTSTLVTYPLDVLRLRLAFEPGRCTMFKVAMTMLREEGLGSFYNGLGPSIIGIAPYIAVNFCIFDLMKKTLPTKYRERSEASLMTALLSATVASLMCYPLDTIRRQMQMKDAPYRSVLDAFSGIIASEGFVGLYRGFIPSALKNLPNSSIKLATFDAAKGLIARGDRELKMVAMEQDIKN